MKITENIETGFYRNISHDDYHSGPGISRSYLHRVISLSPAHARVPLDETPNLKFGSDFHCAVLTPDLFDRDYLTIPDDCRIGSGKGQKQRLADFQAMAEANHRTIIKDEDLEKIRRMREAVFAHPETEFLLSNGEAELSGYFRDPAHENVLCKIRPDYLNMKERRIVDLKKAADARPHRFTNIANDMGYPEEAGFYCYGATQVTGVEHRDFYFIACEDNEPWGVMVYKAKQEMIDYGLLQCARAIEKHLECVKAGIWPAYPVDVHELTIPPWVKRKEGWGEIYDGGL